MCTSSATLRSWYHFTRRECFWRLNVVGNKKTHTHLHAKCPTVLSGCKQVWNFSQDFHTYISYALATRISTNNFVMSVCPSVCPHWVKRLPPEGKYRNYSPGQAQGGSRRLRLPDIKTIGTWRCKVVNPTHRPPLPSGNITGTHFCWRLSRPQGYSEAGRMTSRFVAQCLNQLCHRVPLNNISVYS